MLVLTFTNRSGFAAFLAFCATLFLHKYLILAGLIIIANNQALMALLYRSPRTKIRNLSFQDGGGSSGRS